MKTNTTLKPALRNTAAIMLFISGIALSSCTHQTCSAYATSKNRLNYMQSQKKLTKGSQNIPSPFTAQYKEKMYRRNF